MTRKQILIALVCASAIGIGVLVAVRPPLLLGTVPELYAIAGAMEPSLALLVLVALLAIFTLIRGLSGRNQAAPPSSLETTVQQGSALDRTSHEMIGEALDSRFEVATAYDDAERSERECAREDIKKELRALAAANYAQQTGRKESVAAELVEAGEWTDDPRAAAFLSDDDGPTTPLRLWLIDLLTGHDTFERGVEHTIDSIRHAQNNTVEEWP